ncbi:hypothetical protein N9C66_05285 [Akkermansiaceae bacterium]|jgi:hypothetical protein|nr:hypothetical protein [bacterium]MDA7907937.1 hypothetical protein [Akkermansiaceae bacterium]MDA7929940.1 hypothetical protein [Akkermansiaceae bacterium]MDA7933496.1 hypothetical protein [Akkermansiaceae bacterium]MDA9830734.1 hypothetical protein [Akkermansiaceae bacterium]
MIAVSISVVCGTGFLRVKDHASPDCSQREAVNAQKANPDYGHVLSVNECWGFALIDYKDNFVPEIDGQCRVMREDSVVARVQIVVLDNGKIIAELDSDAVEVIEPGDLVCFN